MQEHLLPIPPEHDPERLRKFEADFTPLGVIRQLAKEMRLSRLYQSEKVRVLCPSAGCGAYPKVIRECLGDRAHITAVEVRPEETRHLMRWCNEVHIGDIREIQPLLGEYDLIIDNPPFKGLFEVLPTLLAGNLRSIDGQVGRLVLLGLTQWGQSESAGTLRRKLWGYLRVVTQYRVGGRPCFRGPTGGTDSREYSHWVWMRNPEKVEGDAQWCDWEPYVWSKGGSEAWLSVQLPTLSARERRWSRRPGTEVDA